MCYVPLLTTDLILPETGGAGGSVATYYLVCYVPLLTTIFLLPTNYLREAVRECRVECGDDGSWERGLLLTTYYHYNYLLLAT